MIQGLGQELLQRLAVPQTFVILREAGHTSHPNIGRQTDKPAQHTVGAQPAQADQNRQIAQVELIVGTTEWAYRHFRIDRERHLPDSAHASVAARRKPSLSSTSVARCW